MNKKLNHERVCKVRTSEEIGVKYMQEWEEKYYERQEGREEGRKEGIRENAERMLRKGCLSYAEIAEYTGLTETQIKEIEMKLAINS